MLAKFPMWLSTCTRRLGAPVGHKRVLVLGVFRGGLAAAALVPMPVVHAHAGSLGDCTLVSGGDPSDVFSTLPPDLWGPDWSTAFFPELI